MNHVATANCSFNGTMRFYFFWIGFFVSPPGFGVQIALTLTILFAYLFEMGCTVKALALAHLFAIPLVSFALALKHLFSRFAA